MQNSKNIKRYLIIFKQNESDGSDKQRLYLKPEIQLYDKRHLFKYGDKILSVRQSSHDSRMEKLSDSFFLLATICVFQVGLDTREIMMRIIIVANWPESETECLANINESKSHKTMLLIGCNRVGK